MTPMTKARYDAEEAKKELLATLHASRDLGSEMDETLADRYIERLGALRPAGSFDPAATRTDLLALLTSARGSDPVGDDALVESFLAGIQPPRPAVPAYGSYSYGPYPPRPADMEYGPLVRVRHGGLARVAPLIIAAVIFIAAMGWSQGHMVWLILPLLFLLSSGRRNRYQRRLERDRRRAYRDDRILRHDDPYHQLPPSGPPEIL